MNLVKTIDVSMVTINSTYIATYFDVKHVIDRITLDVSYDILKVKFHNPINNAHNSITDNATKDALKECK